MFGNKLFVFENESQHSRVAAIGGVWPWQSEEYQKLERSGFLAFGVKLGKLEDAQLAEGGGASHRGRTGQGCSLDGRE